MHLSSQTILKVILKMGDGQWQTSSGYGEPGYYCRNLPGEPDTSMVVLGDYWIRKPDGSLTDWERKYPRLWKQMEAQGVNFEWEDEWDWLGDDYLAYRTQPDSHWWKPSWFWCDNERVPFTADTVNLLVDTMKNDPSKAIFVEGFKTDTLVMGGWFRISPDVDGWVVTTDDKAWNGDEFGDLTDPKVIFGAYKQAFPDNDVLFVITESAMTYCRYQAWAHLPEGIWYYNREEDPFVLASQWHGGQWSALYSFASTKAIHSNEHYHRLKRELRECRKDIDQHPSLMDELDIIEAAVDGISRCDICGSSTDHKHSPEEYGSFKAVFDGDDEEF